MLDLKIFKKALQEKQEQLEALLKENNADSKPVELDQQSVGRLSRMDAIQVQAMAVETKRRREAELNRIKEALKRIDRNDYGYCVSCDEEIPVKRLELDPSVSLCIDCSPS